MSEADVWRVLIATLRSGLDQQGFSAIHIKQSFQPRKTGVDTEDTVYLFKVTSRRVGYQGSSSVYNETNGEFDKTDNYWVEADFQLTAIVERDINDSSSLTSYDIADLCSAILQTELSVNQLTASGIGIERIGEVRNPFGVDDREQFDQSSNFDFIITYNQSLGYTIPEANRIEAGIYRV